MEEQSVICYGLYMCGLQCSQTTALRVRLRKQHAVRARFFFCLIILAFDLYRSWRRTFCPVFLSAVRAVAARCKLPLCPPPRPPERE